MKSKADVRKFLLLTTQRSGSTYIRLWLNSHPLVRCHSEIFLRPYGAADGFKIYCEESKYRRFINSMYGWRRFTRLGRFTRVPFKFFMKRIVDRFIDKLYNDPSFSAPWENVADEFYFKYHPRVKLDQEKVVGFQLMYEQLEDYCSLQDWIADQKVLIIHLIRQNALKMLLSRLMAEKTGDFQTISNKSAHTKIILDQQRVLKQLNAIVCEQEKMRKRFSGNPYLEITYEQFFYNYPEEAKRIFHFLNLENNKTGFPDLKKINPESLKDLIENYEEIANLLHGTPYHKFLE
ncbi:MAG: hypothetical protein CV082_11595 [Candidatus Brocadia sp. BL1]|nr:MAG: hypothetical protein CV082_11595 [Candidatus Brocadia sp. BL1]